MNWLDTSENYLATHNEEVIGAALAQVGNDDFVVASKVAPGAAVTGGGSGFRREQVHAACRGSLERLGRDHIDLYTRGRTPARRMSSCPTMSSTSSKN